MMETIKLTKKETQVLLENGQVVHERGEGDYVHIFMKMSGGEKK